MKKIQNKIKNFLREYIEEEDIITSLARLISGGWKCPFCRGEVIEKKMAKGKMIMCENLCFKVYYHSEKIICEHEETKEGKMKNGYYVRCPRCRYIWFIYDYKEVREKLKRILG